MSPISSRTSQIGITLDNLKSLAGLVEKAGYKSLGEPTIQTQYAGFSFWECIFHSNPTWCLRYEHHGGVLFDWVKKQRIALVLCLTLSTY
jgi:hypothetical protein